MSLYPSFYGSVDIPDPRDYRAPLGRPDGVRVVRRPKTQPEPRR